MNGVKKQRAKKVFDKTGMKFGRLVVIRYTGEKNGRGFKVWECLCECGKIKNVDNRNLGYSTFSCGCLRVEKISERRSGKFGNLTATFKHGNTGRRKVNGEEYKTFASKTYSSWLYLRSGANNLKLKTKISYEPRWSQFSNFLEDMGEKPSNTRLARYDKKKNYCKENCYWRPTVKREKD